MCGSPRQLSNQYLVTKIGFGTVENEPSKVCSLYVYLSVFLYMLLVSFHSDQTFYYLSSSFSTAMSDVLGCLIIIAIESRVRRNLGNEEEGAEGGRSRRGIHGFGFLEVVAFVLIWKGQVMSLTGANAWPARIIARHSRSRGVSTIDTIVTTFLGRIIDINSLF